MTTETDLPPGCQLVAGKMYMQSAKGSLVPVETIRPVDRLMDEAVRKILGFAGPLAAEIARFKAHTLNDVAQLQALLAQEYGARVGGEKGNVTLTSFDGCLKVQVQIADLISFGPELQQAKKLIDDCLREWSEGSNANLRAIVDRAFNVDKEGQINRAELFSLRRLDIEDERWIRAMKAIDDSIRILGSKEYVRFYRRSSPTARWEAVSIDVAAA
jgi:hypothetical protein